MSDRFTEKKGRRRFLRQALSGAGGAAVLTTVGGASARTVDIADRELDTLTQTPPAGAKPPLPTDFTRGSSALQPTSTVRTACQFCNSLCALDVDLKDGRIIKVRGVSEDRVQRGEVCVKADLMTELVYNPHRLRTPMKRTGGAKGSPDSRFEAISWDEAYDIIAKKLIEIRDQGDAHTIANKTSGRMPRGAGAVIGRPPPRSRTSGSASSRIPIWRSRSACSGTSWRTICTIARSPIAGCSASPS